MFFRDSTRRKAREVGATGWVTNRPDGTVEVEVQGDDRAVGAVEEFCRSGPPQARVASVDVSELDPVEGEGDFEVR